MTTLQRWIRSLKRSGLALPDWAILLRGLRKRLRNQTSQFRRKKLSGHMLIISWRNLSSYFTRFDLVEAIYSNPLVDCKRKYFMTEAGCRRGQSCKWVHQAEGGERGCFTCGSMQRFAKECPWKETTKGKPPWDAKNMNESPSGSPKQRVQPASQELLYMSPQPMGIGAIDVWPSRVINSRSAPQVMLLASPKRCRGSWERAVGSKGRREAWSSRCTSCAR